MLSVQSFNGETASKPVKRISHGTTTLRWCSANWRAVLAEFIATAFLIFFGCMACLPLEGFPLQPPLYGPLGFGLIILLNVQIFGHISGCHMNPCVTLAQVIWGVLSVPLAFFYVIAQCAGSIVGYWLLKAVAPTDVDGLCVTVPQEGMTALQAFNTELFLTASLIFLCCAMWDPINKENQESVAIKFGLAVAGLSLAGGPLTGCSMNPARSLGPALWTGIWTLHWVYWAAPLLGALLAVLLYKYVWLAPGNQKD